MRIAQSRPCLRKSRHIRMFGAGPIQSLPTGMVTKPSVHLSSSTVQVSMVKLSGSSADPGRIWAREMAAAAACSELQLRELKNPAVRLLQAVQRYTDNLQVAAE